MRTTPDRGAAVVICNQPVKAGLNGVTGIVTGLRGDQPRWVEVTALCGGAERVMVVHRADLLEAS